MNFNYGVLNQMVKSASETSKLQAAFGNQTYWLHYNKHSLVSFHHVLLMFYKQYAGFLFSSSVALESNFAIMQNNKRGH